MLPVHIVMSSKEWIIDSNAELSGSETQPLTLNLLKPVTFM